MERHFFREAFFAVQQFSPHPVPSQLPDIMDDVF
jgi:hypothetical protein